MRVSPVDRWRAPAKQNIREIEPDVSSARRADGCCGDVSKRRAKPLIRWKKNLRCLIRAEHVDFEPFNFTSTDDPFE